MRSGGTFCRPARRRRPAASPTRPKKSAGTQNRRGRVAGLRGGVRSGTESGRQATPIYPGGSHHRPHSDGTATRDLVSWLRIRPGFQSTRTWCIFPKNSCRKRRRSSPAGSYPSGWASNWWRIGASGDPAPMGTLEMKRLFRPTALPAGNPAAATQQIIFVLLLVLIIFERIIALTRNA